MWIINYIKLKYVVLAHALSLLCWEVNRKMKDLIKILSTLKISISNNLPNNI